MVIAETMKLIQDDAVIDAIVADVMELQDQENTTLPLLEKQMREVENGIENMLNAIQAGVLTNSTKSRLEKLEAQQKELEVRIAEEKNRSATVKRKSGSFLADPVPQTRPEREKPPGDAYQHVRERRLSL